MEKMSITLLFKLMIAIRPGFCKVNTLLQPLRWYYVECVIHHERDVREE